MAFTRTQADNGDQVYVADGGNSDVAENLTEFAPGVDAGFGRGATDTDRTYVKLCRSDGTPVYLYVDTGTTLTVSTTKP